MNNSNKENSRPYNEEKILNKKFLILVLGKSGVGKSVLIHEILKNPHNEITFKSNKIEFLENEGDNPNFSF